MVEAVQLALMVDNRLIEVGSLKSRTLKKEGLKWFASGENKDYLSDEFIVVNSSELYGYKQAAEELHHLAVRAAKYAAERNEWKTLGIPEVAIELIEHSLQNETDLGLIGRFDFAGGMDGVPLKLLEYNADTCSLLPETAIVQQKHWEQEQKYLPGQPFNELIPALTRQFKNILAKHPNKLPRLLISTLGFVEDWLNTDVIALAARNAGFEAIKSVPMDEVTFAPDEGFFVESGPDTFMRFDFWYKFVPWDFIAFEEPELMEILTSIVINDLGVILNPAYTMVLQSKALMQFMYEVAPNHPALLQTSVKELSFPRRHYVRKPVFGRMGENVSYHIGSAEPEYETEGDYGEFPVVYQEIADFNIDEEEHRYQPSIYWTGEAAALCFRRQDDLIIDDDAEFVGSVVE